MTNPILGTQPTGAPSLSIVLVHGAFVDALEDKADEMIPLMRDFLARNLTQ